MRTREVRSIVAVASITTSIVGGFLACGRFATESEVRSVARSTDPRLGVEFDSFRFSDPGGAAVSWSKERGLTSGEPRAKSPILIAHVLQPDCNACRDLARAVSAFAAERPEIEAVGIAYRQSMSELVEYARETAASYPLVHATDTNWVERWSRGDPLFIVGTNGIVEYVQVGYHPDDPEAWSSVVADLAAGKRPTITRPSRDVLVAGDHLPAIELSDLETGEPMALKSVSGRLVFERKGECRELAGAIGFFSRY